VVVAPPGKWRTGLFKRMEGTGLRRNTAVVVSHFLAAPLAVARLGRGIATVPTRVAAMTAGPYGLLALPLPVALGTFPTQIAWHPRQRRDPGHAWLRGLIAGIVADFRSPA